MPNKNHPPDIDAGKLPGQVKNGQDDELYLSVKNQNGKYIWKRIKRMSSTKTPEKYYAQFPDIKPLYNVEPTMKILKSIAAELLDNDIFFDIVGWPDVWDYTDAAWEAELSILRNDSAVQDLLGISNNKKLQNPYTLNDIILKKISFIFATKNNIFWAKVRGTLPLQFNILKQDKPIVVDIFRKYFGKKFQWSGKNSDAIRITITDKMKN